jgi:hypothetical protein
VIIEVFQDIEHQNKIECARSEGTSFYIPNDVFQAWAQATCMDGIGIKANDPSPSLPKAAQPGKSLSRPAADRYDARG